MKLIQTILVILIFFGTFPAHAIRDTDSYDGNIFPIYAGNGSIVPPQTSLKESLKNKRITLLFFYLDDSSDSKAMAPVISGLDLIWKNNIDIIALTTDELQNKDHAEPNQPNYYWNGLIPQTIILNSNGDVEFDMNGMVNIDNLNNIIGKLKGIKIEDTSFSVESFNEYNSIISEKIDIKKEP